MAVRKQFPFHKIEVLSSDDDDDDEEYVSGDEDLHDHSSPQQRARSRKDEANCCGQQNGSDDDADEDLNVEGYETDSDIDDLLSDLRQTRLANQKQGETKHEDTEKEASHPPLHSPASSSSSASPAKEGKEHKKEEQTEKREKRKHEKRQGKDRVAMIDVVCENGLRWVKVRATNPKNLRTSVEGESLFGASFLWGLCWLL